MWATQAPDIMRTLKIFKVQSGAEDLQPTALLT